MVNKHRYEIILYWSREDEAYIVEVPELPACADDGPTYADACQRGGSDRRVDIDRARVGSRDSAAQGSSDVCMRFDRINWGDSNANSMVGTNRAQREALLYNALTRLGIPARADERISEVSNSVTELV